MMKKILFAFVALFSFISFSLASASVAHAASVSVWWPTDGVEVHNVQPWKSLLDGAQLGDYTMYWQVDGGQLNQMNDNYTDYPHKEASVDLSGWNWHGTGPYVLTFVAKDKNGQILAQTNRTIYTGAKTTITATVTQTPVVVTTPAPAPVIASTPVTTSPYTVVKAPTTSASESVVTKVTTPTVTTPIVTTPAPAPAPVVTTPAPVTTGGNALSGKTLYVDPNSQAASAMNSASGADKTLLQKISGSPTAVWLGNWYSDSQMKDKITSVLNGAKATNSAPTFVLYNIPIRDCGSYSAGGANNPDGYKAWINTIANTVGNSSAVMVLEPDALPQSNCLSSTDLATRMSLLTYAVTTLKSKPNIAVYLDGGHAGWKSVDEIADLLNKAGIAKADGFSLNVSNFDATQSEIAYGTAVSAKTGNKHFVIDTSRNGNGSDGNWCNPSGRALGEKPTTNTGNSLIDGFLWIKAPGESDGQCNGGPSAGTWWTSYALGLAKLAHW